MFWQLVGKSLLRGRARLALAGGAVTLGVALVAALLSLSLSLGGKASQELRAYGANVLLLPQETSLPIGLGGLALGAVGERAYLKEADLAPLAGQPGVVAAAPYLHAIVETAAGPVVLAGTRLDLARQVSPGWRIDGEVQGVLLGQEVAQRLGLGPGDTLPATYRGQAFSLPIGGVLESGGPEDSQVLAELAWVQRLTGQEGLVDEVQISALGQSLKTLSQALEREIPDAQVRVVAQVAQAEAAVLHKVQLLMALVAGLVLVASGLAVLSTMTAVVLERTGEIGLMKALGATYGKITLFFLVEAALLGAGGGLLGYGLGLALAQAVGLKVFGTLVAWHPLALPLSLAVALGVVLLGSLGPVRRAAAVPPASILRGE